MHIKRAVIVQLVFLDLDAADDQPIIHFLQLVTRSIHRFATIDRSWGDLAHLVTSCVFNISDDSFGICTIFLSDFLLDQNSCLEFLAENLNALLVLHEASDVDGRVAVDSHVLLGALVEQELDHL